MKFAMNGSLIIGTLDGANIEIGDEIGFDNMFIFGATTKDVPRLRQEREAFQVCLLRRSVLARHWLGSQHHMLFCFAHVSAARFVHGLNRVLSI